MSRRTPLLPPPDRAALLITGVRAGMTTYQAISLLSGCSQTLRGRVQANTGILYCLLLTETTHVQVQGHGGRTGYKGKVGRHHCTQIYQTQVTGYHHSHCRLLQSVSLSTGVHRDHTCGDRAQKRSRRPGKTLERARRHGVPAVSASTQLTAS